MRGWCISCAVLLAVLALALWRTQMAGPAPVPLAPASSASSSFGPATQASAEPQLPEIESTARSESFLSRIEALDDPQLSCGPLQIPTSPGSPLRTSLWPGRYRLSTWLLRSGPQSPLVESEFGAPRDFVVEAGSTVRLTLEP